MDALRVPRINIRPSSFAGWERILIPIIAGLVIVGMWALWLATSNIVTITVDGHGQTVRTHRHNVDSILLDMGLRAGEKDKITPSVGTRDTEFKTITLSHALPYLISVDGQLVEVSSWGTTVGEVLLDADLAVSPYDRVQIGEQAVSLADEIIAPKRQTSRQTFRRAAWAGTKVEPQRIRVTRAMPITVDDGTLPFEIHTTAQTVGEALRQAEILVYLGDVVHPSLGSEVLPSMRVSIQRSRPVTFYADGRVIKTRTRGETVSDALAQAKIGLSSMDVVVPDLDSELRDGEQISIVRVSEDIEIEEEIAPYTTVYVPDANLPIDTQQLISPGAEGITRTRYRVRYEDGEEVERIQEDRWIAQEPADRSIAYGQRIEPKTYTAADGTNYTYWRKIRMLASSYSAGTSGVSPDKSYYGRTYTGEIMRNGIVAVDPSIVPLRSKVFVTGYGEGDALDIGSAIRARRIDLGYADSDLVLWNKWVDVYLMWPPPADYQITWVLPNWPRPPE